MQRDARNSRDPGARCPVPSRPRTAIVSIAFRDIHFISNMGAGRMNLFKTLGAVCVAVLAISACAEATPASSPTVTLAVDATTAPRKIFHASLKIPATPGDLVLYYPKWIPGEHAPDGPVIDLAGLKFALAARLSNGAATCSTDSPFTLKFPPGLPKSLPNSTSFLPLPSKADFPPVPPPPTSSPSSVGTRCCFIPKAASPTTSTTPPA